MSYTTSPGKDGSEEKYFLLHKFYDSTFTLFAITLGLNRERDEDSDTSSTIMEQSVLSSFAVACDLLFHNCYGERVVVLAKKYELFWTECRSVYSPLFGEKSGTREPINPAQPVMRIFCIFRMVLSLVSITEESFLENQ
jgi:hypothetical protein